MAQLVYACICFLCTLETPRSLSAGLLVEGGSIGNAGCRFSRKGKYSIGTLHWLRTALVHIKTQEKDRERLANREREGEMEDRTAHIAHRAQAKYIVC